MRLRALAMASMLVTLADAAWADTALIVIDARPRPERAAPAAARIAGALRGPGTGVVRHLAADLPADLAPASALLEQASDALTRFRDREALERVAQAEEALSDADLAGPEARDLLVRLNWIAAQSHMALGRPLRVDAACRLAHQLAPDRRLPRDELAPAFVSRCEKAARRAARSLPLSVAVQPPGARVSLDLVPVEAGAGLTASEGDHYLRIEADGHQPVLRRVTVAGRGAATAVELQPLPPAGRLGRAVADAAAGRRPWAEVSRAVTRPGSRAVVVVVLGPDRMAVLDAAGRHLVGEGSAEEARLAIAAHVQGAPVRPDGARLTARSPEAPAPPGRPWYRHGWVWVGVTAAVGIAAGSYLWLSRDQEYVLDDWSLSQ